MGKALENLNTVKMHQLSKVLIPSFLGIIITLPILYGIKNSADENKDNILKIMERGIKEEEVNTIRQFAKETGGIDYAEEKAKEYADKAVNYLNHHKDSNYKESLIQIAEFITSREF